MRAREPDRRGTVVRDGVETAFEVFGDDHPITVLLLPTWSIVHSRLWKAQVPALARDHRVITIDGRGNGASGRPPGGDAYVPDEFVADAIAVLDETGTDRAVVVGLSFGGLLALLLAARFPERVVGTCFIDATIPFAEVGLPRVLRADFDAEQDTYDGWEQVNRHAWERDHRGFLEFFFEHAFTEPHSTKQREDCVQWGLDTTPETLIATAEGQRLGVFPMLGEPILQLCEAVTCPTLLIHGDEDEITPYVLGAAAGRRARGGPRHDRRWRPRAPRTPSGRREPAAARLHRPRRVRHRLGARPGPEPSGARSARCIVSSPIGLGHAQRDVGIADELRRLAPDLQIDWLAQHPVTSVLAARNETVHPASAFLANESSHIESESHEHDLHAFQAIRDMDEILVANFGVFQRLMDEEHYDLVIADEAWDLDYFLHENPELKRCSFAWMTDFVGWPPMENGGEREARITADYNAEMIEHVARFKRIRDRSIFVGDPDDIVPEPLATVSRRSVPGPRNISRSPATSPASIPYPTPNARVCERRSATRRTRPSAS